MIPAVFIFPEISDGELLAEIAGFDEVVAAGWDESRVTRNPAGERDDLESPTDGGKFAPKRVLPKPPKLVAAEALKDRLGEIWYKEPGTEGLIEHWGEWTPDERNRMIEQLRLNLREGTYSGLLSVDYSNEIGMSFAKERGQARTLLKQLERISLLEQIESGVLDAEDFADELWPAKAEAKPKAPDPRSQGVPELYLSESGKFKPGFDAKLKSDLVASALEWNKRELKTTIPPVPPDLAHRVAESWRVRNPGEAERQQWTDEQLWQIAKADPMLESELQTEVRKKTGMYSRWEPSLLHTFEPAEARRILEERGWGKYLTDAEKKLQVGGRVEVRSPVEAGMVADAQRKWGDALTVRGIEYERPTLYATTAGMFGENTVGALVSNGVEVHVGAGTSTDQDSLHYLAKEQGSPIGWGNSGLDKAGGFWSPSERKVTVGTAGRDGSANVTAHEIAHAIGSVIGVDDNPELRGWHGRLYPNLKPYYKQGAKFSVGGRKELWAEGVAVVVEFERRKLLGLDPLYGGYGVLQSPNPEVVDYYNWVRRMLEEVERDAG